MNIYKLIVSLLCLLFLQTANADECADKIAEMDQVDAEYQKDADMRVLAQEHLDELLLERARLDSFTSIAGGGLIGLAAASTVELGPAGVAFTKAVSLSVGVIVSRNALLKSNLEDYKGRIKLKGAQNARARTNLQARRTTLQTTNCGNDDSGPVDDSEPDVQLVEPIGSGGNPNQCVFCVLTPPSNDPPGGTVDQGPICPVGSTIIYDENGFAVGCIP